MADFEDSIDEFTKRNVAVIASSVDSADEARKTVETHNLTFHVGYGLNGPQFAADTGAFYDRSKGYVQATGFVLQPDGIIARALYSTGPVGRFTPGELLRSIDYMSQTFKTSTGRT